MKRILHLLAVLSISLIAVPLFAAERNIVDDVIKMTRAGVTEDAIVDFVHKSDGRYNVSADDMIAMSDAKVSRVVMKAVLDEVDARHGRAPERDRIVVDSGPRVVVAPYFYDPYYYYDPFWYGPRLSLGFRFGGGFHGHRDGFHRHH